MTTRSARKQPAAPAAASHTATSVRPPPPDPGEDIFRAGTTEDVPDIESLSETLGPATEREVAELLGDVAPAALIDLGRRVTTGRVSEDAARVVHAGRGFFERATPAQRGALAMAPDVLRVLAWTGAQGHRAWRSLNERKAHRRTAKTRRRGSDRAVLARARALRDQLADTARKVAAGRAGEPGRIDAALRPAAMGHHDASPGRSLASLVAIGREYLVSEDAGVQARCRLWGLTAERLDECDGAAQGALATWQVGSAPAADFAAEQAVVDRWDGVNLVLIEQVLGAFARGHGVEPAVPKLKVVSLRGVLGTRKRPRKAPGAAPAKPTPAPADPPAPR